MKVQFNGFYPYQITTLSNLPGEKWKPIEGFEEYYHISSYGRIRALPRELPSGLNGAYTRTLQERVLKGRLAKYTNKTIGEPYYKLSTTFHYDGIVMNYSLSRLVYNAFVEPIDVKGTDFLICSKDGDGRNIHYKNLVKRSPSQRNLMAYQQGRMKNPMKHMSHPVTCYDKEGIPVAWYESFHEAAEVNEFNISGISKAIYGEISMYKSFFWRLGHHKRKLKLADVTGGKTGQDLINRTLMHNVGMKRMPKGGVPAFLNLSLADMPGEKWRDVPRFNGLYKVSSFGRIKSLKRISNGQNLKVLGERILKLIIRNKKSGNKLDPETGKILSIIFTKDGKVKPQLISKLVYYCFVEKIDLDDQRNYIHYKDRNPLNICPENLVVSRKIFRNGP